MAEFVRKVDAPVSLSLMGQCALDNTKDCYIGMLGMHGTKTAAMTLSECDLMSSWLEIFRQSSLQR